MSRKFEIFTSYRRKGGYDTAKILYEKLKKDGYSISFDLETLEMGDFDDELEKRVRDCKDFLLVLSPGVFDRFFDPEQDPKDDWVRREIVCALEEKKNIVPIFLDGFVFPKNLPNDVKDLAKKNGLEFTPKHFEGSYNKMKQVFLKSKPHWSIRHRKLIFALLALVILSILGIGGVVIEKELKEEMRHRTDSLAKIMDSIKNYNDSISKARVVEVENIAPSTSVEVNVSKSSSGSGSGKMPAKVSGGKSLHWVGPKDAYAQTILNKISAAGVRSTKCSSGENGMNINVNKPKCDQNMTGKVSCSYSPKLTLTDCNGKMLHILESSVNLKTSIEANEALAKEKLVNELRSYSFSDWVSFLKK